GTRGGWRERENEVEDGEWKEVGSVGGRGRGGAPGGPRRPPWDGNATDKEMHLWRAWEENQLPEWAMDNEVEKDGSFDAAGSFHGPGWTDEDDPNDNNRSGHHDIRPIQSQRPRQKSGNTEKLIKKQGPESEEQLTRSEDRGGPDDEKQKKNGDIGDVGTADKQAPPSESSGITAPLATTSDDLGDSK
ncbi:unnamed protein product, partial [Meganyctiphanes norvegica]